MWIDEHGSDVLGLPECRRLLAVGARDGRPGHLGIPRDGAPLVLPVDYAVCGPDVVVQVGERVSSEMVGRLVAFQVDDSGSHPSGGRPWSVLVRGLAVEERSGTLQHLPAPRVVEPGHCLVRIRADVVTGRRIRLASQPGPPHGNQVE